MGPSFRASRRSKTPAKPVRRISGSWKAGPRREILFRVQPHANAGRQAAAAAGALDRVRLRDRLHAQALHAVPRAVAADAREARIHDVADPRHRQRRLGDIRREHDARRLARARGSCVAGPSSGARTAAAARSLSGRSASARARRRESTARRAGTRACRGCGRTPEAARRQARASRRRRPSRDLGRRRAGCNAP